ncbi:MAG: ARMT1-like domain-containing protein [Planctomycetota bacterium]|nr:ARMT1-like domain-containing protein [Planctomycetota bacterium]
MKTFLDCIPCFVRQALDAARLATDDQAIHEQILREVLRKILELDFSQSPPQMGRYIHTFVRELADVKDPYRRIKDKFNRLVMDLYPELKSKVDCSSDPLATAVRLAIAGNIIDFGIRPDLEESAIKDAVSHAMLAPLDGPMSQLAKRIPEADEILYLADNAGEIVFDRLLIERLPMEKVTVVVKAGPIINDATLTDAVEVGLTKLVKVIDNGTDAPGTILDDCSEAFQQRFDEADLVIAKGQGNYETLNDLEKDIFFILKAKCPVVARDLGVQVNESVLQRSQSAPAATKGGEHNATR